VDRPRNAVMEHMTKGDNLMLLVPRSVGGNWEHAFVSNSLVVDVAISARSREANQSFPLHFHNGMEHQGSIFDDAGKSQNINWNALPGWMATIQSFTSPATNNFIQVPEAIFYYIYAILYSNIYREKYQEFLKSDFPRIPFTNDYKTFQYLAVLREQLVEQHLLKSKLLENPISRYEGHGDNRVEKRAYIDSDRVFINDSQFFDRITPKVWNYYVGGYQVLDKWLKDRNGRVLSLEDQLHFRKIVTALTQTVDIQERIDKFYPKVEESLTKSE